MQLSKKRLTSKEFALIEELVEWNTKIKDIVWIIGSEKAELYAKHCYKVHIPEHLDSQSRDTRTLKRQHLDISPAHLNS